MGCDRTKYQQLFISTSNRIIEKWEYKLFRWQMLVKQKQTTLI